MCLNVGLVYHIQPSSITQVVEPGVVGVVAGAHCIEVEPLCVIAVRVRTCDKRMQGSMYGCVQCQ
jgi:hypothetical protein